jgi:hypothetical protein
MKKIKLTVIFFIVVQLIYGYTRLVHMDKEVMNAKIIGEIVIRGYTSRLDTFAKQQPVTIEKVIDEMSYVFIDHPDSVINYKTPNTPWINVAAYYHVRTKSDSGFTIGEGHWPAVGDTVLMIADSSGTISLFAEITNKNEYVFWSPYHTSSWNTIFLFNPPFKPALKPAGFDNHYSKQQSLAKNLGYQFSCTYHCMIDKVDFWLYISKIKKQ